MKIATQNLKIKVGNEWVPFLGANTGQHVKYTLTRDEDGNIVLEGDDASSSQVAVAPLHIGEHTYNGTKEVTIEVYDGEINDAEMAVLESRIAPPQQMTMIDTSQQMTMTLINDSNIYQMK